MRLADAKRLAAALPGFEELPPKFDGMVEQLVCAAGRRFAGTPSSTFTSYIFRLRGYMAEGMPRGAPDPTCFFHTSKPSRQRVALQDYGGCSGVFKDDALMWRQLV